MFSKNHPAPFSKVITFHKKEPFGLEAFYTYPHEVPYPDPRIGEPPPPAVRPHVGLCGRAGARAPTAVTLEWCCQNSL